MDNRISDRMLFLDLDQCQEFSKYSEASYLYDYYIELKGKSGFIDALFYEIRNIHGNWTFKDRVLPSLIRELDAQLLKLSDLISKYEQKIDSLCSYDYGEYKKDRSQLMLLYNYLHLEQFRELLKIDGDLSANFTHDILKSKLKKLNIRIKNCLSKLCDETGALLKEVSKEGLNTIIVKTLKDKLPLAIEPELLIQKVFFFIKHKDIVRSVFQGYSNHYYDLAMRPIWYDMPGSASACYYFNAEEGEGLKPIVLMLDRSKPDLVLNGTPYVMNNKSIHDYFTEIGEEHFLENWFNLPSVKQRFAWHICYHIYHDLAKKEGELTAEDYTKSTRQLKDKIERAQEYYGMFLSFEEIKEEFQKQKLARIEEWHYTDEEKARRREIVGNLLPMLEVEN